MFDHARVSHTLMHARMYVKAYKTLGKGRCRIYNVYNVSCIRCRKDLHCACNSLICHEALLYVINRCDSLLANWSNVIFY